MNEIGGAKVHPTAIIERDVSLGDGTAVYDHVHIRHGAKLGEQCIVGGKTYIAYDVSIGNRVKINSQVYICFGVTIEDGVFIGAGTIFTNDLLPRATTPDLKSLLSSDPNEETRLTRVKAGASIGAGAIIGSGLEIGSFAMIGMGAIVTRSIPPFHLVIGSPARSIAAVCRCGEILVRFDENSRNSKQPETVTCHVCKRRFQVLGEVVTELTDE